MSATSQVIRTAGHSTRLTKPDHQRIARSRRAFRFASGGCHHGQSRQPSHRHHVSSLAKSSKSWGMRQEGRVVSQINKSPVMGVGAHVSSLRLWLRLGPFFEGSRVGVWVCVGEGGYVYAWVCG